MMEKRFKAVAPQLLIVDGDVYGLVSVSNTKLFKVKQIVKLQIPGSDSLTVEIKRIESSTVMYVGPVGGSIDNRNNTSGFTVASGAFVYADEQMRPKIPEQEVERNTYEEEPVVARRVILVDTLGNSIDNGNPLPIVDDVASTPENIEGAVATAGVPNSIVPTSGQPIQLAFIKNPSKGPNANSANIVLRINIDGAATPKYVSLNRGEAYYISGVFGVLKIDSTVNGGKYEVILWS
jgi:hypothetical protein